MVDKTYLGMVGGTVEWFNDKKGFGFIRSDKDEKIFCHISTYWLKDYSSGRAKPERPIVEGDKVMFLFEKNDKGLATTKFMHLDHYKVETMSFEEKAAFFLTTLIKNSKNVEFITFMGVNIVLPPKYVPKPTVLIEKKSFPFNFVEECVAWIAWHAVNVKKFNPQDVMKKIAEIVNKNELKHQLISATVIELDEGLVKVDDQGLLNPVL